MGMYQALYRSYRPETFQELLGQEHIVRILKNQLDAGTTGHAYLFCGTRGTGKTSTARILAKGLNCLAPQGQRPCGECAVCRDIAAGTFVDVIEIDAASNNGVDNIRELRESVNYPPASGRSKVYVIDEAHMLSTPAANALLKTLEEPPESIVFILATTEPQKLPATILSRCLRLDFHRVSEDLIRHRFAEICKERGIEAGEDALALIASNADGSVRDGLSLLDRCAAGNGAVTREVVLELLG
ncbi:MAG: DNA polymerase III subunit gamma/tau, partial [Eubacteriales bacterium]|nr:DNA polymerase III subunit gamma/tau [Eubacteriales bacterium]